MQHSNGQHQRATTHGPNSISSTYVIDDGTMEDSVGFGDGFQSFQSVWVNQFAVIPGQTTITAVEVIWGTPNFPQSIDGTPVTIGVWSDPNGDGNPSDAALLGSVAGTVQQNGTDTPITYTFSPAVTLPAGATSFFLGDLTPANPVEEFFQGIDEDSTLHRQSWVVANGDGSNVDVNNLGNNDLIGIIDDFGLPGNWGIRGDTSGGGGEITLDAKGRTDNGRFITLLRWSPANGGPINVLRDGVVVGTTQDDGKTKDKVGRQSGTYTYQVCESDTGTCSNEVQVTFH
jgi:hypothetical protein